MPHAAAARGTDHVLEEDMNYLRPKLGAIRTMFLDCMLRHSDNSLGHIRLCERIPFWRRLLEDSSVNC